MNRVKEVHCDYGCGRSEFVDPRVYPVGWTNIGTYDCCDKSACRARAGLPTMVAFVAQPPPVWSNPTVVVVQRSPDQVHVYTETVGKEKKGRVYTETVGGDKKKRVYNHIV